MNDGKVNGYRNRSRSPAGLNAVKKKTLDLPAGNNDGKKGHVDQLQELKSTVKPDDHVCQIQG